MKQSKTLLIALTLFFLSFSKVNSEGVDRGYFIQPAHSDPHPKPLTNNCNESPIENSKKWGDLIQTDPPKPLWEGEKVVYKVPAIAGVDIQDNYTATAFEMGHLKNGVNKGSKIILTNVHVYEVAMDPDSNNIDATFQIRFLKKGDQYFFLPKMSQTLSSNFSDRIEKIFHGVTKVVTGLETVPIDDLAVSEFGEPQKQIKIGNECINFYQAVNGISTNNELKIVETLQNHPLFGKIYKSGKFLYVIFPDHSLLSYYWIPYSLQGKTFFNNGPYECYNEPGKREPSLTADLVRVDPDHKLSDLQKIGDVPSLGPIFGEKPKKLKQLFKDYTANVDQANYYNKNNPAEKLSYNAFEKSNPIIYWQDPFGRMIWCENTSLNVPNFAEPLIYLYPERMNEKIAIQLLPPLKIFKSEPALKKQKWNVVANPDSTIKTMNNPKTYQNLFWEGNSGYFPLPNQGTVVEQKNVRAYLEESLSAMGLNQKEKAGFIRYWAPLLEQYPYILIHFYEPSFIDQLAPLQIDPKPDTMIRVHMDYRPLEKFENYPTSPLPEFGDRKGFTVVEWGGMRR